MQLTRLEIKGFKSFGDKITINFNAGVTAIAGPNGCGKSNVVDAIRWVLGEQSTKTLRSEKMENIIFNGTKTRKPSQLAEVSLTFDNTKNILPTEFSQVTITRKLYRSGESEYRLNDVQCRLKDITDLFLDTGLGSDTYSIIELKMIDEIIANKEGSRRGLFEESSGISKYKLRKKQTFNKLKDTEADLSRVEDLLFEIEKNLKTLENQARKAERYYRLKEQYQALSVKLAAFRISSFRDSLEALEEQEQKHRLEKEGLTTEIDRLEAALQQFKAENITREKNLSTQQKASNEFTAKIRAYESEKKIKNEQLRFLQDKEKRLTEELDRDKNQLNHVLYNIKRLNEEHLSENEKLQSLGATLNDRKEELDELRLQQQSAKTAVDHFVKQNNELQNHVYKLEKDLTVLNIQKDALLQESRRNIADTESKETELSEFNQAINVVESKLKVRKEELENAQQFEDDLDTQIKNTDELLGRQKDQLSKENRRLDAKQNEYNLTKSLVDNLEGFPESIRFLKKNAGWARQAPLLSDVLFCKEEYRIAIENYLEPVMNHYVVETQLEAVQAIKLLSDSSKGRANFFILEALEATQEPSSLDMVGPDLIPALSIIETEPKYSRLCRQLLRNVFILISGEDEELVKALPEKNIVILSGNGKFTKNRIAMAGGSVGLFEGKRIGRAKNLENLAREIKKLENSIHSLKASIDQDSMKISALRASSRKEVIRTAQTDMNRLNNELISLKTRQEQYITFIQNSQNRKQDIELKIHSIEEEIGRTEPELNKLKDKKQEMSNLLVEKQQAYNELAELVTEKATTWNQDNIRFHQQQNKVSGIDKDLDYRYAQQQNLESRINTNDTQLNKTKAEITETLQHVDHSDEDLLEMYARKDEFEKGVREAEQAYYQGRAQITDTENGISTLRRKKEQSDLIGNEIRDKKTGLKLDLNALKERLSVEFAIDISSLLDTEIPTDENEQDLRGKTEKLKRQLDDFGAINSMAMEAYKEMNERYTFIQNQKKDLLEAKTSLIETIREIDESARTKFMDAFLQARENFKTVFRSLFNEEDSCDLILSNPDNPLESDIDIIARPKGKRPLSINQLSGGEKTLTATALLFSLYLLKPAPFCIFDEVDAPLDDTNIDKFNKIIRKFSDESQFIVISHNKRTIASTDVVYGVTMIEQGISRVVAVDLRKIQEKN